MTLESLPLPSNFPSTSPLAVVRVVWWTQVCPVGKYVSYKMRQGLLKERRLQQLQKRRTLHAFGLKQGQAEPNVDLYSPNLGLAGRLDLILKTTNGPIPVEIKFTKGPARLNHKIQLAGYALLLEDLYRAFIPHGYIVRLPDNNVEKVLFDQPLRELTSQTIRALRMTIQNELIPPPNPIMAKCSDCEYRLFCGDVA